MAALCLAACSHERVPARFAPTPPAHDRLTRVQLTQAEMTQVAGGTLNTYAAIELLRPTFLTARPGAAAVRGQPPQVHVYLDGAYAGPVAILKTIPVAEVESIQRFDSATLALTFGGVHPGDMILMVALR